MKLSIALELQATTNPPNTIHSGDILLSSTQISQLLHARQSTNLASLAIEPTPPCKTSSTVSKAALYPIKAATTPIAANLATADQEGAILKVIPVIVFSKTKKLY
jgi:hypothetical protein